MHPLLFFKMREPLMKTRFVVYQGEAYKFFKVFDSLVEQLIDEGITDVRYQSFPRFRLWIGNPVIKQIIFLQKDKAFPFFVGSDEKMISIDRISKFFKED